MEFVHNSTRIDLKIRFEKYAIVAMTFLWIKSFCNPLPLMRYLFPFRSETTYRRGHLGREWIIWLIFSRMKFFLGMNSRQVRSVTFGMGGIRCPRRNGVTERKKIPWKISSWKIRQLLFGNSMYFSRFRRGWDGSGFGTIAKPIVRWAFLFSFQCCRTFFENIDR